MIDNKIYKLLGTLLIFFLLVYAVTNLSLFQDTIRNLKRQIASTFTAVQNGGSGLLRDVCANYKFNWAVYSPAPLNIAPFPHIIDGRVFTLNDGLGLYPHFDPNTGQMINGGIPQAMDANAINAHKLKVQNDLASFVPDPNYDGMIIFDYESWPPQWDLLDRYSLNTSPYKTASINLVLQQHPDWEEVVVIAEAKRQWEEGAKNFYLATIEAARQVRPRAKLGAYGLMYHSYYDSYSDPVLGAQARAYDDQIAILWTNLDVIAIDIYQFFPSFGNGVPPTGVGVPPAAPPGHEAWYDENKRYVRENIWEGNRLKGIYSNGGSQKTVIPYAWPQYHSSEPHAFELLRSIDLYLELIYPLELGADGVVIWDWYQFPHFNEFPNYLSTVLGPMIENYCNGTTGGGTISPGTPLTPPPPLPYTNQPPLVNAGADQNVSLSVGGVTLSGVVTDDGKPNPPGVTNVTWSAVSGPSAVVFSSATSISTGVTFSSVGTYVLRLTASDGVLGSSDTVSVVVNVNPPTIEELLARIRELQEILRNLQATLAIGHSAPTSPISPTTSAANQNLTVGSTGPMVTALQKFLVSKKFLKMPSGVAYGTFGQVTRAALAKFQSANLIYPANGYYGLITRKLVNQLR